ncbi:polysaccharide biosynthesis/export family protein [Ramlibacter sp.]|uniref:polysaccharide biosynthesis/export family protein n=1 Tax=Ramlibacter sp. TaxID=1917967 RepID=UPI003D0F4360
MSTPSRYLRWLAAALLAAAGFSGAHAQGGPASLGVPASGIAAPSTQGLNLSVTPSLSIGTSTFGPDRLTPGPGANRALQDAAAARGAAEQRATATATVSELPLTAYQRFVLETTGRNLPLFGYNLFAAGAFPAAQNVPVPADYVLGPGDEIDLKIWGAVDADLRLGVDRNGQVAIPRVGTLNVAGLRVSQLEPALRTQIGRVYNNFQISATLGPLRSIQVFVVGQARRPGAYTLSSVSTLVSALFEVGGPSATGTMRNIQLRRDGRLVTTLDLYRFIAEGDKSADARLLPGDVITIPPAGPRVAVTGSIDNPAIFELAAAEEPLAKVLSYGGRTAALTTPHKVLVERIDPGRARAPRSVEERTLDARGLQSTVRDGDVVTLFQISPEFSNAVTLRGNVAAPLRYAYRQGMRIADLIPEREALIVPDYYTRRNLLVQYESGRRISDSRIQSEVRNLLDEINWDYAVIERLDARQIRSQLIPFNLAKAVIDKDPESNLVLQPGDVVTIFGTKDLPVPVAKRTQYVRIAGEVNVPGVYQITPGETLEQIVRRAGGFTPNAYPFGSVFTRESTREQQQANLDRAIRRMESDLNSQSLAAIQNTREESRNEATIQAQLATQRQFIARLQTLRASGRIALEMDPRSNVLPPIQLEDGDQLTVPNLPSFVGVFGAVTAETSFLHRFNYSVRDYIGRAGPTRDADEDFVAVIRADGSVESDNEIGRGIFGKWSASVLEKRLNPGDTIFVPEKFDKRSRYTRFIEGAKDLTAIFYQFGLGAAALKTLRE